MIKLELAYNDIIEDDFYLKTVPLLIDGKFDVNLYGQRHEVKQAKEKFGDLYKYTIVNNMPISDYDEIQKELDFDLVFKPEKVVVFSYLLGSTLIANGVPDVYMSVLNSIRSTETANELKRNGYTGFVLAHDKVFDVKFQKDCKKLGMKLIALTTMGCPPCLAFSEKHHVMYMKSNKEMGRMRYTCPTIKSDFNPIKLNIFPPSYMYKEDFSHIDEYKFSGRFIKFPEFSDIYKNLLTSFLTLDDEKFVFLMFKHFIYHDQINDEIVDRLNKYTKYYLENKKLCAYHCWECAENCDDKFSKLLK